MNHQPNCRYGHGNLIDADRIDGVPVTYGLVVQPIGNQQAELLFLTGLKFLVCETCGYSELQDTDVKQTLKNKAGTQ